MSQSTRYVTLLDVLQHAREGFYQQSVAFRQTPSAQNWNDLTRAMLVHQQAQQLSRDPDDRLLGPLLVQVNAVDCDQWDELIVRAVCGGRGIDEVLASDR